MNDTIPSIIAGSYVYRLQVLDNSTYHEPESALPYALLIVLSVIVFLTIIVLVNDAAHKLYCFIQNVNEK